MTSLIEMLAEEIANAWRLARSNETAAKRQGEDLERAQTLIHKADRADSRIRVFERAIAHTKPFTTREALIQVLVLGARLDALEDAVRSERRPRFRDAGDAIDAFLLTDLNCAHIEEARAIASSLAEFLSREAGTAAADLGLGQYCHHGEVGRVRNLSTASENAGARAPS